MGRRERKRLSWRHRLQRVTGRYVIKPKMIKDKIPLDGILIKKSTAKSHRKEFLLACWRFWQPPVLPHVIVFLLNTLYFQWLVKSEMISKQQLRDYDCKYSNTTALYFEHGNRMRNVYVYWVLIWNSSS